MTTFHGLFFPPGQEGMQAIMASDFAIARFRFLKKLLLVHGNLCVWVVDCVCSLVTYQLKYSGSDDTIFQVFFSFQAIGVILVFPIWFSTFSTKMLILWLCCFGFNFSTDSPVRTTSWRIFTTYLVIMKEVLALHGISSFHCFKVKSTSTKCT